MFTIARRWFDINRRIRNDEYQELRCLVSLVFCAVNVILSTNMHIKHRWFIVIYANLNIFLFLTSERGHHYKRVSVRGRSIATPVVLGIG